MKVAIIGAGNMGGAIARGLAQGTIIPASDVTVADPFSGSLETLQADYPEINVTTENPKAIKDADIVILAVKPWSFSRNESPVQSYWEHASPAVGTYLCTSAYYNISHTGLLYS